MADCILTLPTYITAAQLAACDLSADDGLQLDAHGGITRAAFLQWFDGVTRRVGHVIQKLPQ